jgi:hypothetical protein
MVYFGFVITLLVLLPNLLMLFFPPQNVPPEKAHDRNYRGMEIIERVGQVGCFALPVFYPIPSLDSFAVLPLVIMIGSLLFYYAGWLRYLIQGREFRLLFVPMLGLPLPLAVAPILYFLSAAAFLYSWPLGLAAIVLATGHLYISRQSLLSISKP